MKICRTNILLTWASKHRVLSRTTLRLLTCVDGKTIDWLIITEKLSDLPRVDFVPTRRISVLPLLCLRKFDENLFSAKQLDREIGGKTKVGMEDCIARGSK